MATRTNPHKRQKAAKRRHLEQGHHHSTSLLPCRGNDIQQNDEEYSLLGSVPEEVVTTTAGAAAVIPIGTTTTGGIATTGREELLGHVDNRGKVKQYVPGMGVTNSTITPMNKIRIEKPTRELVWPWYKFFPEASEREMEWKIISNVFNAMQPKFVGSQEECQQWKVDHTNIMSVTFNSMKNYVISRIKEAVEKYYHENNHTMPNKELLLACGDHTIDMGDNPESTPPEPNLKHFVFYWDKLLPACTAPTVDSWGKETRYYTKLSPKNKAITAPDEAFLCLCIDNYWARWEKMFELKGANPGCTKVKSTATKPRHLPTSTTNQ
jgi:hypothetical protein